jgi:hypothetical protein
MDPTMQSPVRATIPFSGGTEVTLPSGPHYYPVRTWVGSKSAGVTPQQAFESLSRHATPFQSKTSVDDGIVDIPGLGPVRQLVDPDRLTIVNRTEPGHILYPGNVFRSIVQDGDDLYVQTHGYGTGIFPWLNEEAAPVVWREPDLMIRAELNNRTPSGYPMDEMNTVAGIGGYQPAARQQTPTRDDRPELRIPPPIFFPPY